MASDTSSEPGTNRGAALGAGGGADRGGELDSGFGVQPGNTAGNEPSGELGINGGADRGGELGNGGGADRGGELGTGGGADRGGELSGNGSGGELGTGDGAEPGAEPGGEGSWTPEEGLPSVKGLNLIIPNDNQLLVQWNAADIFDGYQVSYARNVLYIRAKKVKIQDGTVNNLTLDGLDTTKRYYVRVRGYRMYGGDLYYTEWTGKKTSKSSADASIKFVKKNGAKVDIRKQAGSKLRYYSISQGSCSDGKYLYMCFERRNGDDNGASRARIKIAKVRISDWKLIKVSSSGQKLGHANDITYNANQKILVVTGAKYNDPYVRIVSPKTLKKTATKKVKLGSAYKNVKAFNAIDYDAESYTYYIRGREAGYRTFTLDENFRIMDSSVLPTVFPTRHVQSCTSTSECFFITQSWYQSTGKNTVTIFRKTGEKLQHIKLKLSGELESIFFIGEKLFATVHKHCGHGYITGYIFEILL